MMRRLSILFVAAGCALCAAQSADPIVNAICGKTQEQLGMCRLCDFLQRSVGGDGALRPRPLAPDFFAREKLCNRLVAFDSV